MLEEIGEIENTRIVYQQACENLRYRDELCWGRFKTISIIEGAFLLALYQFELQPSESLLIVVFGCVLVLIVSLLGLKDRADTVHYYLRSVELEREMGIAPLYFRALWGKLRGRHLVLAALLLINLFNMLVLIKYSNFIAYSQRYGIGIFSFSTINKLVSICS